jgi:hypothetical protein
MANDGFLMLQAVVSAFAFGLRQNVKPKEIVSRDELFVAASLGGLDVAVESFQDFWRWGFGGVQ